VGYFRLGQGASWKNCTHVSCGDEISILSGMCKLETRTHMGNLLPRLLWRRDFHLVGRVQVGNSHPHGKLAPTSLVATRFPSCRASASWKTCTHMGKFAPTSLVATRFPSCRACASWKLAPTWENLLPRLLWRQDFIVSGMCKLETRTHMGKLAPTSLCGDKISSCRRQVQVGNSHPHGETRTHMGKLAPTSLCGDEISSCRGCASWKTRTHMGWENLHPHGKTCTHVSCGDKISILSGMCKLETRTHMGKLAARCGDGSERTRFQKADQTAGKSCRNGSVNCKSRG